MGEHVMKRTSQMWRDNTLISFFLLLMLYACVFSIQKKRRKKIKKQQVEVGEENLQYINFFFFFTRCEQNNMLIKLREYSNIILKKQLNKTFVSISNIFFSFWFFGQHYIEMIYLKKYLVFFPIGLILHIQK